MPTCFACNRPVPVTFSRFLAPELLLVFGIVGIFWFSLGGGNYSKHLPSFQFYGVEKLPALLFECCEEVFDKVSPHLFSLRIIIGSPKMDEYFYCGS